MRGVPRHVRTKTILMSPAHSRSYFLRQDIGAGVVVFLIALPLCLGISLASDAPILSGVITGIVAGLLVSVLSGSEVSVSGPAAGLATVVAAGQQQLGSFEALLVATILAGLLQVLLGVLRAGFIASLIPSSVIHGMVVGIGLIIMFRQVPHALGWKGSLHFDESLFCVSSDFCRGSTVSEVTTAFTKSNGAATLIFFCSLLLLVLWARRAYAGSKVFLAIPPPLAAVAAGVGLNWLLGALDPELMLRGDEGYLVQLPALSGLSDILRAAPVLNSDLLRDEKVWQVAGSLAIIASIQSLLSVEAADKIDPWRRVSDPNRELLAQGLGNIVAGAFGGLPMTSVIVRSSANVYAGAHSRVASLCHGALLLFAITTVPALINQIPLASLGAILLFVGFQLVNPKMVREIYQSGPEQFIPFVVTTAAVMFVDLFTGVLLGTAVGLLIVLKMNFHTSFTIIREGNDFFVRFAKDVTFLQKFVLRRTLAAIPDGANVYIDGGGAMFVDYDIRDVVEDFKRSAPEREIEVSVRNVHAYKSPFLA